MFSTFTNWEFDNIKTAQKTAETMWPNIKAASDTSFKATQTGENTVRTLTVWPDAATARAAINKMRTAALEQMSGKVTGRSAGTLMLDLS